MSVRSAQLAVATHLTTTQATLYTVPAGIRTIVKSVIIRNQAAAAQNVTLYVYRAGSEIMSMTWHPAASGASGDTVYELPWFVMNAADQLRAVAAASFAELLVSGTELVL